MIIAPKFPLWQFWLVLMFLTVPPLLLTLAAREMGDSGTPSSLFSKALTSAHQHRLTGIASWPPFGCCHLPKSVCQTVDLANSRLYSRIRGKFSAMLGKYPGHQVTQVPVLIGRRSEDYLDRVAEILTAALSANFRIDASFIAAISYFSPSA